MKNLTLVEAARMFSDKNKPKSEIINLYIKNKDILDELPYDDIPGGAYSYDPEGDN